MTTDWQQLRERHDPDDMFGRVERFPEQMDDAWGIGTGFVADVRVPRPSRVVVCGMGGSAIGADMAASFLGNHIDVPMTVCRDYTAPGYFRNDSLVIISSYSGNTAETLSAYESLAGGNSTFLAITSGGHLAQLCSRNGVPVCSIPGGMPPRSALGYSLLPTLLVLRAAGVADFDDREFAEARAEVERRCRSCANGSTDNPAVRIAEDLRGNIPFVYAAPGLLGATARRWSCQFNENSKSLAHFAYYSELNHNEIVGWNAPAEVVARAAVVSLEDVDDGDGVARQRDVGIGIIEPLAASVTRVPSAEGGRLARMLSSVILGDFTSVYLALLGGVDPTPVEKIDYLKSQL